MSDDPFIKALQADDVLRVAQLLGEGRTVTERFHFDRTPLHIIAEAGAMACAKELLARGAWLEAHDQAGHTALIGACGAGHRFLAEFFVGAGARLHYRWTPDDTPAIRAEVKRSFTSIYAQSRKAHPEIYGVLDVASPGMDPQHFERDLVDGLVATALETEEIHAIHHCVNLETLQVLGKCPGISFNVHDGAGDWPLKAFSAKGDADAVAWLLGHGADPNFTSTGESALHAAVGRNQLECARVLLHAGANPNQQDVDGCVPMWVLQSGEMLDLLLTHGADPDIGDQAGLKPSSWVEEPKLRARLLALEKRIR